MAGWKCPNKEDMYWDGTLHSKKFIGDGSALTGIAGSGDVSAAANLTDEKIVQGDGGAKGVKTSTASISDITTNTAKVSYTDAALVAACVASTALNTAKVSYTDAALVAACVASTAINTAKVSYDDAALVAACVASTALNTAKTSYTDAALVANCVASTALNTASCALIDPHIADNTIHYAQGTISIPASQISDFDTEVSNNISVSTNTAKTSYTDAALVAACVASTAINTAKVSYTDAALVAACVASTALNTSGVAANTASCAVIATNTANIALNTASCALIQANTDHKNDNTQAHSDYLLNSGADSAVGPLTITADNSSADTAYVPMVLYNTDDTPPAASGFPVGTIYVQYTA